MVMRYIPLYVNDLVCTCTYATIYKETKRAATLVFAMHLCYIYTCILAKYEQFQFLTRFLKKHQGYSSRFFKKWGSEVGNEIKPILVRMYVYMS